MPRTIMSKAITIVNGTKKYAFAAGPSVAITSTGSTVTPRRIRTCPA